MSILIYLIYHKISIYFLYLLDNQCEEYIKKYEYFVMRMLKEN